MLQALGHVFRDALQDVLEVVVRHVPEVIQRRERPVVADDRRPPDLQVDVRGAGVDGVVEESIEIHFGTTPIGSTRAVLEAPRGEALLQRRHPDPVSGTETELSNAVHSARSAAGAAGRSGGRGGAAEAVQRPERNARQPARLCGVAEVAAHDPDDDRPRRAACARARTRAAGSGRARASRPTTPRATGRARARGPARMRRDRR